MITEEFIEECWFVYGIRFGDFFAGFKKYHSKGTSGSVDFDWKDAMNPLLIGWIHTHGAFGPEPSETDNTTMRSWVKGRACPMLCGIYSDEGEAWYEYFRGSSGINRSTLNVKEYSSGLIFGKRSGVSQIV